MQNYSFRLIGVFLFIIDLIPQALGWLTFQKQYIIKSAFCTYYMNGNSMCPLFFNGLNNKKRTYQYCYQFDDDCQPANSIREFYIASLCLPLLSAILFLHILYLRNNQNKKIWVKRIWITVSLSSIVLFTCVIVITHLFANNSSYQVNIWIRDQSWIIFSIRIFQLALQAYFFHYFSAQFEYEPRQQPGQQPEQQPGQQPGQEPGQQPRQQPGQQPVDQPEGQQKSHNKVYPEDQNDEFFTQLIYNPIDEDLQIR